MCFGGLFLKKLDYKRILVFTRSLEKGVGISKWIVDYYSSLSRYKNLDITLMIESGKTDYTIQELDSLPFKVYKMPHIKKHPFKSINEWKKIRGNSNNIDWYHFHTDNCINFIPFLILKSLSSKVIVQSHNSYKRAIKDNPVKRLLHICGKRVIKMAGYHKFAVSDLAAKWLFDNQSYIKINNGIDLEKFEFSIDKRNELLNKLNLRGYTIYGHVGRFDIQKNHHKLISIFKNIHQRDSKTKLILIGDGPLKERIREEVYKLGIQRDVIFLGMRNDVNLLLNIIDVVIFPSFYEGLPLALVEAQANGIQIFYSSTITTSIKILSTARPININDDCESIAKFISKNLRLSLKNRLIATKAVRRAGFDKNDTVHFLYDYYVNNVKR